MAAVYVRDLLANEACVRSVTDDYPASGASTTRATGRDSLRTVRIRMDVDDEGTAVLVKQGQRSGRETHSAGDEAEQSPAPAVNVDVDQITRVIRVVAIGVGVTVRPRIEMAASRRAWLAFGGFVNVDGMLAFWESPNTEHDVYFLHSLVRGSLAKIRNAH